MAQPKVGITAELLLGQFLKNVKEYLKAAKDIDKQTKKTAASVTKSTQGMTKSWNDFLKLSDTMKGLQAFSPRYDTQIADIRKSFQGLASTQKVNIDLFDQLTQKNVSLGDAFQVASSGAKVNADAFALLYNKGLSVEEIMKKLTGASRGWAAAAKIGAKLTKGFTISVTALANIIRKSIKDFAEAAEEVRRLTDQFGISVEEADRWRRAANAQGQSATTLARAFTQASSNLVNYEIRLAEGEERVTNFQRALDVLKVSVKETDGTLRDSEDILKDVNDAIRDLGAGYTTTGIAQDVYGRGAYLTVIPALLDQTLTAEKLNEIYKSMGATMSIEDVAAANELRVASTRLKAALAGTGQVIARDSIPMYEKLKNTIADLVGIGNIRMAQLRAQRDTDIAVNKGTIAKAEAEAFYAERLNFYRGISSEAAESEEELRLARAKGRQETILAELAERKLAEQRKMAMEKLVDVQTRFNEKLADIEVDFSDRWEDILIDRSRDAEERTIEMFQKLEDIWRKNQRKLEDISIKADNRIADLERDRAEITEDFQARSNKKREDLELKHQERLWKIQMRFLDTVEEAARRNDAVAVVAAMRRRRRELRDAERQKRVEQRDLGRDLNERRREINRDFDRRKQDALRQQAEEEARAQLAHERALEDFRIANERERVETLRKYRQQEQDFDRNKRRALRDARTWYRREQQELQVHMQTLNNIAVQGVIDTTQAVAAATSAGVQQIAAIAAMGLGSIGGGVVAQALSGLGGGAVSGESAALREWLNRNRGIIGGRAKGGIDIVNRPTTVTMGEAGSELHAFIPLRGAMNVSHQFSRLPIDLNGAQGMNPQEVRSIIYDAMTDFASKLSTRWTRRR